MLVCIDNEEFEGTKEEIIEKITAFIRKQTTVLVFNEEGLEVPINVSVE